MQIIIPLFRPFVNHYLPPPKKIAPFPQERVAFWGEARYNFVMVKIWAKVLKDGRILRQTTFESGETFTYSHFFSYLAEICGALDVPTPVLLKPHLFQFAKFRHVVFRPSDFLEDIGFDRLMLENLL